MPRKLTITITVEAEVYDGLHRVIGRRRISRFLNDLACPPAWCTDPSSGARDWTGVAGVFAYEPGCSPSLSS
jgi:hypothetical protein